MSSFKSTHMNITKNTRPLNKSNNKAFKNMINRVLKKHVPKSKTFNSSKSHLTHKKIRLANGSVKEMYKIVIVKKVSR
jgi:hypothetical protein